MPRPRYRACLQDGLKLDLNRLARKGYIGFGANIGIRGITWSDSYWGEVASGFITADMTHPDNAWFEISIGGFRQRITLVSRPRHFGGRQWFFQCPATNRLATAFGGRREPLVSAAGRHLVGKLLIDRNFSIVTTAPTLAKSGSRRV